MLSSIVGWDWELIFMAVCCLLLTWLCLMDKDDNWPES